MQCCAECAASLGFEPRIILAEGGNDTYKATGLLDWDSVLSVPVELARRPPAWLYSY